MIKSPPYLLGKVLLGAPGRLVLIGSLFYKGDRKVTDHKKGEIDCKKLRSEMKTVERVGRRVGLDHAVDIIAETPQAMERYVQFLSETTEDPLFIGGLNEESRVAGYRKARELGVVSRCGVNSISPCTTPEELDAISENGIKFAILQTLDPSAVYPEDKVRLLKEDLLGKCERAGIEGAGVDVGIIDFTSAYLAVESFKKIREELNLPSGCAPSNAAYQPLVCKKITRKSARAMNVALNTFMQAGGADFILYGPLKASTYAFEAAAIVEAIKAYGRRLGGEKPSDRNHPLYTFLPKLR